ncbi:MAG: DUF1080 domain-containing protein [Planctomycetota bacterium]
MTPPARCRALCISLAVAATAVLLPSCGPESESATTQVSPGGEEPAEQPAETPADEPGEKPAAAAKTADAAQSIALFNGKDLAGWHVDVPAADGGQEVAPSFAVRGGVLVSLGNPQGHLITDADFGDYRLTVEWRWPGKPGNCGVLVHASQPRRLYKMFPQSIECQLHHGNAGDFWCIGENISVPEMATRRAGEPETWGGEQGQSRRIKNLTDDSEKPLGEWNEMVIECKGASIDIWVNGDHVNNGSDCTAVRGQIALQAEGAACEFRKVELLQLAAGGDEPDANKPDAPK